MPAARRRIPLFSRRRGPHRAPQVCFASAAAGSLRNAHNSCQLRPSCHHVPWRCAAGVHIIVASHRVCVQQMNGFQISEEKRACIRHLEALRHLVPIIFISSVRRNILSTRCRADHFLCEEEDCQNAFMAYSTEAELAQHRRDRHSRVMPRFNRDAARRVDIDFGFGSRGRGPPAAGAPQRQQQQHQSLQQRPAVAEQQPRPSQASGTLLHARCRLRFQIGPCVQHCCISLLKQALLAHAAVLPACQTASRCQDQGVLYLFGISLA